MSKITYSECSLEEKIIFLTLASAWPLYMIGGLYIAGPVVAVTLGCIAAWRAFAGDYLPQSRRIERLPFSVWMWLVAMIVMLIALLVGHFQEGLGMGKTIKSSIGWAKGWLLLALFPLAGACLSIRLQTICNGNGWFALMTLCLTPVLFLAPMVGLPERLFVSPLKVIGGSGPEYFTFFLYTLDPESGAARLQYTAPWAPAAGLIANMMLILAIEDHRLAWRVMGIITAISIVMLCRSRMALLCMLMAWPMAFGISQITRGWPLLAGSAGLLTGGLFASQIISIIGGTLDKMNGMRAGSNRVRGALNDMAFDRWWTEARLWGHGIVERGPHHVEYMPIGSHHTWLGLLFVKGIVGFLALAIVMVWTTFELAIAAQMQSQRRNRDRTEARAGLAVIFVMWFFSFSENLEVLAYLYWSGLIVIGLGLRAAMDVAREAKSSVNEAPVLLLPAPTPGH